MFKKYVIDTEANVFEKLASLTKFEDFAGRKLAVLVNPSRKNEDVVIPLVRTTTIYHNPVQKFAPTHYEIMDRIRKKLGQNILFNNASIEIYDSNYRDMKYHTDQSLDLEADSMICLFSCYENDSNNPLDIRKLLIKNKISGECSELVMDNNSVVVFSTATNQQHVHKIILESNRGKNRWLGLTLRLSKTFIKFCNDIPYIYPTDKILRMANFDEKKTFYKCKGMENSKSDFSYPEINYTISLSDMLVPT